MCQVHILAWQRRSWDDLQEVVYLLICQLASTEVNKLDYHTVKPVKPVLQYAISDKGKPMLNLNIVSNTQRGLNDLDNISLYNFDKIMTWLLTPEF